MSDNAACRDYGYTRTKLFEHYLRCVSEGGCEKKSAERFMKSLPEDAHCMVLVEARRVTYLRRNYGRGQFYCWATHPEYGAAFGDPWPASVFPKALMHACLALAMADKHPSFSAKFASFVPR